MVPGIVMAAAVTDPYKDNEGVNSPNMPRLEDNTGTNSESRPQNKHDSRPKIIQTTWFQILLKTEEMQLWFNGINYARWWQCSCKGHHSSCNLPPLWISEDTSLHLVSLQLWLCLEAARWPLSSSALPDNHGVQSNYDQGPPIMQDPHEIWMIWVL